jgi:pyruvate/2-oxoglutarate/acetoin dehydrogenase E1 component
MAQSPLKKDVFFRNSAIRKGVFTAIYEQMKVDPMVYYLAEGAHMKVHYDFPEIERDFPNRVITHPIAEESGVNFSLGASLLGVKPLFDIITTDFMYRAMDSIANTCATTHHVVGDLGPIIIKAEPMLMGPSSGQRPEALFAHIPNLNVVVPSNQLDAYDLMNDALNRKEITIFFEDRMISDVDMKPQDKLDYIKYTRLRPAVGIGEAKIRMYGKDLTVVSYGLTLQRTEKVLDSHPEWDVTLIDLITVKPFDRKIILESVIRTNNFLFIEPDIVTGGVGAELVASISEEATRLKRKIDVKRVGAPLKTIPGSIALHDYIIPNGQRIEAAIKEML